MGKFKAEKLKNRRIQDPEVKKSEDREIESLKNWANLNSKNWNNEKSKIEKLRNRKSKI